MWDVITYPFLNFSGATVEFYEWISNFIPHFTGACDYLSMLGLKLNHVRKRGHWSFNTLITSVFTYSGNHSVYRFSKWDTTLHCNGVPHWLSLHPELSMGQLTSPQNNNAGPNQAQQTLGFLGIYCTGRVLNVTHIIPFTNSGHGMPKMAFLR